MPINKEKISELARDCHEKKVLMEDLNNRVQKGRKADDAAAYAIANVEYKRAKKILENVMAEESVILVQDLPSRDSDNAE